VRGVKGLWLLKFCMRNLAKGDRLDGPGRLGGEEGGGVSGGAYRSSSS
jgi:hypothetical protein